MGIKRFPFTPGEPLVPYLYLSCISESLDDPSPQDDPIELTQKDQVISPRMTKR